MKSPEFAPRELPPNEAAAAEALDESFRRRSETLLFKTAEIGHESATIAIKYPELQERAEALRVRNRTFAWRCRIILSYAAMLISLGLGIEGKDYLQTRNRIEETTDADGGVAFRHEDPETTQILDYLAGKSEIPADIKRGIEMVEVRRVLLAEHMPAPQSLENMSEDQLLEIFNSVQEEASREWVRKYGEPREKYPKRHLPQEIPARYRDNKELYRSLWQIEKASGNPRVRIDLDVNKWKE